jgi:hypothetical protein
MPVLSTTLSPQGIQWGGVRAPRRKEWSPTEGDLLEGLWVHVKVSETTMINILIKNELHMHYVFNSHNRSDY